ncbi:MAG: hypothetical protein WD638_04390 [Nitriliruptoraceae bacterium]
MSETPRPWWASEDAVVDLDDVDPVDAFRQARRSGRSAEDPEDPDDPDDRDAAPGGGGPSEHDPAFCGVCPLCTLARTLEDTRPELLEHLTQAARHLASAVRVLLETPPDPDAHGPASSEEDPSGLQRIDLDQDHAEEVAGE